MPLYIGQEPFQYKLKRSPYYWWWAYLKLNKPYIETCKNGGKGECSDLYKDFGDIRRDGDRSFLEWWGPNGENHGRLFQERTLMPEARLISSRSEWTPEIGRYPYVVIAVDLHMGLREATKMINEELKQHFVKREGRTPMPQRFSTAKYKLSDYGRPERLEDCYLAYIAVNALIKKFGSIGKIPPKEYSKAADQLQLDDNQAILDLHDQAETWISWVGQGSFPGKPLAEFHEWEQMLDAIVRDSGMTLQYME
jgi:hypothetical protein